MKDVIINNTKLVFSEKLVPQKLNEEFKNSMTVFLHSANYKFSLGSGSSFIIKQIIEAEQNLKGFSVLEKVINKIRKTPVCGVKLTSGGYLPNTFSIERANTSVVYPNFHHIVHCVIPGPRIDDFEEKISGMLKKAFNQILLKYQYQEKPLFLCLPIIGVNNFGYPVDITLKIYVKQIRDFIYENQIQGTLYIWLKNIYFLPLKNMLLYQI